MFGNLIRSFQALRSFPISTSFILRYEHPTEWYGNRIVQKATPGKFYLNGVFICHTLEELWRNNMPDNPGTPEQEESCLPPDKYFIVKRLSPAFGWTPFIVGLGEWDIKNYYTGTIPNRRYILFHPGNTVVDTLGCTLVGDKPAIMDRSSNKDGTLLYDAVENSRITFRNVLMPALEKQWALTPLIPFEIRGEWVTP